MTKTFKNSEEYVDHLIEETAENLADIFEKEIGRLRGKGLSTIDIDMVMDRAGEFLMISLNDGPGEIPKLISR